MCSRILNNNDGSVTTSIYFNSSDNIEDFFRVIKENQIRYHFHVRFDNEHNELVLFLFPKRR